VSRIPRAAWLAAGCATAAIGIPSLPGVVPGSAIALAAGSGAAFVLALTWARRPRARVPVTAFGVGVVLVTLRLLAVGPPDDPPVLPSTSGPWLAVVEAMGPARDGAQVATIRLMAASAAVRLAATLPRYPEVAPGAVVAVGGGVPREPPDGSYGDYLERAGIAGTIRARTLEIREPPPGASVNTFRRMAGEALSRALPEPEAGLAAGILVGLRELVDRDLAAAFTTAGASHVVAISGWNIALVGGIVAASARNLRRRQRSLLIAAAVVAYTIAAGASPSVVRAAAMASVALLARESGRPGRAASALGGACAVLLVADPGLVRDAGFQLSVVATAGLLAWAAPVTRVLERASGGRLPAWITEGLGVSLAAQAATLPIVLGSFGRLSLVAPAVNLIVVPLVPVAMAAGAVALVAGLATFVGAPAALAPMLGLPAWLALTAMVRVVRFGASVPAASVELPGEAWAPAGLAAGLMVAVAAAPSTRHALRRLRGRRARAGVARRPPASPGLGAGTIPGRRSLVRRAALVVVAPIVLAGLAVGERIDRASRVTVLDVGQGDAVLIETQSGGRVLVDGGPDPDRLLRLLDERVPPWDRRLDLIVLTHPHEDHAAGLGAVLDRYRVASVSEPGMPGTGPGWIAWDERVRRYGIARRILGTGARVALGELRMTVLWPDLGTVPTEPGSTGREVNDVSIVLLAEVGSRRLLLTGDIEDDVDPTLVARGLPDVDVLKVAHHGSATATTDGFLQATTPRIAIVSAGRDNPYGHPAPATLARLRGQVADVRRTDLDGSVELAIEDGRVDVRQSGTAPASRGAALRYDRRDDGPGADRGRPTAAVPRSTGLVPPPFAGGGGDRGMARAADRCAIVRGSGGCRGGGAAARRRQGPRSRRSRARPPPRRRIRGLARTARPSRARTARRRASRHAARGRRRGRVALRRADRGAGRRLRGQARGPAARVDGRPVRFLAAAVPRRCGKRRLGHGNGAPGRATRPRARARGVHSGAHPAGRGATASVDWPGTGGREATVSAAILGHFRGDDTWSLERAAARVRERLADGASADTWRVSGAETTAAAIAERVSTSPLFGGGTLAIVVDPGPLLRSKSDREAVVALLGAVAPGNGLVFLEPLDGSGRRGAALEGLEAAVAAAGGEIAEYRAPREGALAGWIAARAAERGVTIAPDAAKELARRVGGFVREGDVDRRGQAALAIAELDKLALYRGDAPIRAEDVAALTPELVPDSLWALLDAVATRQVAVAGPALDRALETTPEPVLVTALHRRLRELLDVADRLAAGATPASLVRSLRLKPFRAQKLAEHAASWTAGELTAALEGLLELDAMIKRAPGAMVGDAQRRLAWTLWVGNVVRKAGRANR